MGSLVEALSDLILFISRYDNSSFTKSLAAATEASFNSVELASSRFESRPKSCRVEIPILISSLLELTFKPFKNAETSSEDTCSSI